MPLRPAPNSDHSLPIDFSSWSPEAKSLWSMMHNTMDERFNELLTAFQGMARQNEVQHAAVASAIGQPADEHGGGGSGLAGEVSRLRLTIGEEPDADGYGGRGILGRLALHDKNQAKWDGFLSQIKGAAGAAVVLGGVLAFILRDQLAHLFSVPAH